MVFSRLELCAGATVTSIGKAAAEEASWAKLQRSAVWWKERQLLKQGCTAWSSHGSSYVQAQL